MRKAFAWFLLAVVVAWPALAAPSLSGRWYLEGEEEGSYIQYLVDRNDDGTFSANIRIVVSCDPGGVRDVVETGRWEFRDGILYNHTLTVGGDAVNSTDAYYEDSFAATFVDDDHVTMRDLKTEITWRSRRVNEAFEFPPAFICTF